MTENKRKGRATRCRDDNQGGDSFKVTHVSTSNPWDLNEFTDSDTRKCTLQGVRVDRVYISVDFKETHFKICFAKIEFPFRLVASRI